jgi:NTP pyrophosphatase (non-canonical NTP hydrolase)
MGLLAETGEVAAVFQKLIRGDFPPDVAMTKLFKELGDVLWHVSEIANDNNWTLQDIAQGNVEKLESRQLRNVLLGNGDNR